MVIDVKATEIGQIGVDWLGFYLKFCDEFKALSFEGIQRRFVNDPIR